MITLELPDIRPHEFAVELAKGDAITWKTVATLAEQDRNPCEYILRIFGEANTAEIAKAFRAAKLEDWAEGCEQAKSNQHNLLKEISEQYIPALEKKQLLSIVSQSCLRKLKGGELTANEGEARPVIILYCLQPIIASLPMPFTMAKWHRIHCIAPLKTDSPNMDMELYISKVEARRVAFFDMVNALFSGEPTQVTLTTAQWIDFGRTIAGRWVLNNQSKLQMLKRWLSITREAQKCGEQFLKLIHVDDLFTKGACSPPNKEAGQKFQCNLTLSPSKTYPAWELHQVMTFVFRCIFNQDPMQRSEEFINDYKTLFKDTVFQSLAAHFCEQMHESFKGLGVHTGLPNFFAAHETLNEYQWRLNSLMNGSNQQLLKGWSVHYKFLNAALFISYFSYLWPLSFEQRYALFKAIITRLDTLEQVVVDHLSQWRLSFPATFEESHHLPFLFCQLFKMKKEDNSKDYDAFVGFYRLIFPSIDTNTQVVLIYSVNQIADAYTRLRARTDTPYPHKEEHLSDFLRNNISSFTKPPEAKNLRRFLHGSINVMRFYYMEPKTPFSQSLAWLRDVIFATESSPQKPPIPRK